MYHHLPNKVSSATILHKVVIMSHKEGVGRLEDLRDHLIKEVY